MIRLSAAARRALVVGALLPSVALAACGNSQSPSKTGSASATAPDAKPTAGGTIQYGHQQEVPCVSGAWVEQADTSRQVLDSLTSVGDDGKVYPWLAKSWTTSKDGRTWTFRLRDDVKFTDGTPLTADAIVKNFDYWLDPKTINGTVAAYVGPYYRSSTAVDAHTFRLTLSKPYSWLPEAVSQGYFGIHSPKSLRAPADQQCLYPVGSGPFIVKKFTRGQGIQFVKNPDYDWAPANAKHQGPAYADELDWKFVKEPATRWASLTTGANQAIYDVPAVDWKTAQSRYKVLRYLTQGVPVTAYFNTVKGPLTDERVRRAVAYSLDRAGAVKSVFGDATEYSGSPGLSAGTPFYDKTIAGAYTQDYAKANQLLDAAGWSQKNGDGVREKDGKPLRLVVQYPAGDIVTQDGQTVLQSLQQQAKQAGIDLQLAPITLAQLATVTPDTHDVFVCYWSGATPAISSIVWSQSTKQAPNGNNFAYFNSQPLTDAVTGANATSDEAKRTALYKTAQQVLADDVPAVGLYARTTSIAYDPSKIEGLWLEGGTGEPVFSDAYLVK